MFLVILIIIFIVLIIMLIKSFIPKRTLPIYEQNTTNKSEIQAVENECDNRGKSTSGNSKSSSHSTVIWAVIVFVVIFEFFGFYSVQPIGYIPEGVTCLVVKYPSEPFFNSPDAVSIKRTGKVSLLTRGMALMEINEKPIVLRLPYIDLFYSLSVDGKHFEE